MAKIRLLNEDLKCPICRNDDWCHSIAKVDITEFENSIKYNEQIRYMFECNKCGYIYWFGRVDDEDTYDWIIEIKETGIEQERNGLP